MLPVVGALLQNSGSINRFELAHVRCLMGHLSEATTLLHYQHMLDLIRMAGFSRTHPEVSEAMMLGSAGVRQNSRARGSRLSDAPSKVAEYIDASVHLLPPKNTTVAALQAASFQNTSALRDSLILAMSLGKQCHEGQHIPDTTLDTWGVADQKSISETVAWVERIYLTGEFKREMEGCFERLQDQGSIDCLQVMLENLNGKSPSELRISAADLSWLAETRCRPYLSFRLDGENELVRAASLLEGLLHGMPLAVAAKRMCRDGKKWIVLDEAEYPSISDIPAGSGFRYVIKLKRGKQRFPHRALSWLTIALLICSTAH